jgi:hypothetical protein
MSDPTEDLWNALTSGNTRKIIDEMRRPEHEKPSLEREWEDELRRSRRHRSWEDQAADDAGVPRFGPI